MALSSRKLSPGLSQPGMTNNPYGQPEYQPTEADRKLVVVLAALKVPQHIIAEKIGPGGIDPKTLRKHFRGEIDDGREHLIGSLKALIVQSAMKGSVRAQTWLLERLDPEQFAPRYTMPDGGASGASGAMSLPIGSVETKVEIYLPDNQRDGTRADNGAPEIDGSVSDA